MKMAKTVKYLWLFGLFYSIITWISVFAWRRKQTVFEILWVFVFTNNRWGTRLKHILPDWIQFLQGWLQCVSLLNTVMSVFLRKGHKISRADERPFWLFRKNFHDADICVYVRPDYSNIQLVCIRYPYKSR